MISRSRTTPAEFDAGFVQFCFQLAVDRSPNGTRYPLPAGSRGPFPSRERRRSIAFATPNSPSICGRFSFIPGPPQLRPGERLKKIA
jgi:hypothetical protein